MSSNRRMKRCACLPIGSFSLVLIVGLGIPSMIGMDISNLGELCTVVARIFGFGEHYTVVAGVTNFRELCETISGVL